MGQKVKALPSNSESTISEIVTFDGNLEAASSGQAVTIALADEIDISRGDVIVPATESLQATNSLQVQLVWMHDEPLVLNKEYNLKLSAKKTTGRITTIDYLVDVNTLEQRQADVLSLNEIAIVTIELTESVVVDPYTSNRETGSLIVIDRFTNGTVGAGMVKQALKRVKMTMHHMSLVNLSAS